MTNIDKDLISNKSSCYIFDIDGCLADVDHLLFTYEEAYKKEVEDYVLAYEKYQSDYNEYEYQLKQYNKGLIEDRPIEPIQPMKPTKPDESKNNKWAASYFYKHLDEAIPIGGILDLFVSMALIKKVIILTGRDECSRTATLKWLNRVITERYNSDMYRRINFSIIFKPDKDKDSVEKFKRTKILELAKQYNVQLIIDDCPKNIEEFTKLGFLALTPNRAYKEV